MNPEAQPAAAPTNSLASLDQASQQQLQQIINQSVQQCLTAALPQAISQSLSMVNAQAQPQVNAQGVSPESMAAAVATALAAQKDKKESKEPSPWEDFLAPTETEATNAVALELIKLFKTPPNLQSLKLTAEEIPKFRGIPVSAPPRPHPQDKSLHAIQEKLRTAMLCFVNAEEEADKTDRYVGAAFLRSAHEDLLQLRRKSAAGRKAYVLEPRADDPRESLFTSDEEKKMKGGGRGRGGGNNNNSSGNKDKGQGQQGRKGGNQDRSQRKGKGFRGRSSSASSRKGN
jgi:hypothetical protein